MNRQLTNNSDIYENSLGNEETEVGDSICLANMNFNDQQQSQQQQHRGYIDATQHNQKLRSFYQQSSYQHQHPIQQHNYHYYKGNKNAVNASQMSQSVVINGNSINEEDALQKRCSYVEENYHSNSNSNNLLNHNLNNIVNNNNSSGDNMNSNNNNKSNRHHYPQQHRHFTNHHSHSTNTDNTINFPPNTMSK